MAFNNKKRQKVKQKDLLRLRNILEQGAFLVEGEQYEEAIVFLEKAVSEYPKEVELWQMFGVAATAIGTTPLIQKAYQHLIDLEPDMPANWLGLLGGYDADGYIALSQQVLSEVVQRFPNSNNIEDIRKLLDLTDMGMSQRLAGFGMLANDRDIEIVRQHERVQVLMGQNDFQSAIALAHKTLKKKKDFIPTLNNLSLALFMNGEAEKALITAQNVLDFDPNNYHALGNSVRYSRFLGKDTSAKGLAKRLEKIRNDGDVLSKKIEAYSFICADELVVETFNNLTDDQYEFLDDEPILKHLTAFAFYNLGDEKKAKRLWEEIVASGNILPAANENLEGLALPAHDRNMYGLSFDFWIPTRYIEKLVKSLSRVKEGKKAAEKFKTEIRRLLKKYPFLLKLAPILLERGDLSAKRFVIRFLGFADTPESAPILEAFAFGKLGSDQIRREAAMVLSDLDVIANSVKMWVKGEERAVQLLCFEVGDQPMVDYPLKPKAEKFLEKGIVALQDRKFELAGQYLNMAAKANGVDHPSILYNLLAIEQMTGDIEVARNGLREIVENFPEYSFAGISMASEELRAGNVKRAKELADRFVDRKKWHHGEIGIWLSFNIELAIYEKKFDSARNFLKLLAEFDDPTHIRDWENHISKKEDEG